MAAYNKLLAAASTPSNIVRLNAPIGQTLGTIVPGVPARIAFVPGSIGWVIEQYLKSDRYDSLKRGTRVNYRSSLDLLKRELGGALLADLTVENVNHYCAKISREHGRSSGDHHLKMLSNLWRFARGLRECVKLGPNPTRDCTKTYRAEPHLAWPEDLQRRFLDGCLPQHRLAFMLLRFSGQRRGDVIAMKWTDYDGRVIRVAAQEKTGVKVTVPVLPELRKVLDATPRVHAHILTSARKRPFGKDALTTAFRERLIAIGAEPLKYTLHGLRKCAGVMLAESGCTVPEIMSVLGHTTPKQAMEYCREANNELLAHQAMKRVVARPARKPRKAA
jgi:integrase